MMNFMMLTFRFLLLLLGSYQVESQNFLRRPPKEQFHIPLDLINNLGMFFQQDFFTEKCTFVADGDIW